MLRPERAAAIEDDEVPLALQSERTRDGANSAISGILIAVGCSLLLWAGLAQVARMAARAIL